MTNREFYQTVATGTINEEVITKANELIAKMDAQNAARREKVSKKALENAPLVEQVISMLGTEPLTATVKDEYGTSDILATYLSGNLPQYIRPVGYAYNATRFDLPE